MKEEKSCKNCKYYLVHYVKTRDGLQKTECGHCTYDIKRKPKACENWEEAEKEIPALQNSLVYRLETFEKNVEKLQCIIDMLKDIYGK